MILNVNTKPLNSYGVPDFTYTGTYEIVDDNNNVLTDMKQKNWRIRFLTSGELTFTKLKGATNGIDAFIVGGGGCGANNYSGSSNSNGCGGAGGGQAKTFNNILLTKNSDYTITIGNGGTNGSYGGQSSAFDCIADGGKSPAAGSGYGAGNGGESSGAYRSGNGGNGVKEFGVGPSYYGGGGGGGAPWAIGTAYSPGVGGLGGGGAGGDDYAGTDRFVQSGQHGTKNTGGGGGGAGGKKYDSPYLYGGTGGSGIVIIRNVRTEPLWGDTPFSGTMTGTTTLNVRNMPSSTATGTQILGTISKNRKVLIYEISLDSVSTSDLVWGRIQETDISGWIALSYLTISAQGIISKKEGATVYSSASANGTVVATLPLNTILTASSFVKGDNQVWTKISSTYNGTSYSGYVLREYINFSGN